METLYYFLWFEAARYFKAFCSTLGHERGRKKLGEDGKTCVNLINVDGSVAVCWRILSANERSSGFRIKKNHE